MSKPNDFRVWSYQDAWTLAMQHIVEGEKIPTSYGSKNLIGVCAGACVCDCGDHLNVYHDDDDRNPWVIWYEEGGDSSPCNAKKDDDTKTRIKTLVHNLGECKAMLSIIGDPIPESVVNVSVHKLIERMKVMYEKELTEATGLPIEKFNI